MKIAVIGAGAAGLAFCAACSVKNKKADITVFEKNSRVGKKILVTGNGRCNLTNMNIEPDNYYNYGFAKYALNKYSSESNIEFFKAIGLYTYVDNEGRVYPMSDRAQNVLNALRWASEREPAVFLTNTPVNSIEKKGGYFTVNNEKFDRVIICAGGVSAPEHGSDGSLYPVLKKLGHSFTPLCPSLVQLKTENSEMTRRLKGIRCKAEVTFNDILNMREISKKGELLFTDYGLSGIVVMEISSFVSPFIAKTHYCAEIGVSFFPDTDKLDFRDNIKTTAGFQPIITVEEALGGYFHPLLISEMLKSARYDGKRNVLELSNPEIYSLYDIFDKVKFKVYGTRGFKYSQVTHGGISIDEINPETMESKIIPGLYFAGEIIDVDGSCGGYNLNWAWASARLAAEKATEE